MLDWVMRMASLGQTSWQQLQLMQSALSSAGRRVAGASVMAWTGQAFSHLPQPMQLCWSMCAMTR